LAFIRLLVFCEPAKMYNFGLLLLSHATFIIFRSYAEGLHIPECLLLFALSIINLET